MYVLCMHALKIEEFQISVARGEEPRVLVAQLQRHADGVASRACQADVPKVSLPGVRKLCYAPVQSRLRERASCVRVDERLCDIFIDTSRIVPADEPSPVLPRVVVALSALLPWRRLIRRQRWVPRGQLGPRVPLHEIRAVGYGGPGPKELRVNTVRGVRSQLARTRQPGAEKEGLIGGEERVQVAQQCGVRRSRGIDSSLAEPTALDGGGKVLCCGQRQLREHFAANVDNVVRKCAGPSCRRGGRILGGGGGQQIAPGAPLRAESGFGSAPVGFKTVPMTNPCSQWLLQIHLLQP